MQILLKIEDELLRAMEGNEFVLYYQPQYNIATSTFDGLEALIRWQHPEKGVLLPEDFLDAAENSGIMIPIGAWALRTACVQFKNWEKLNISPKRVAVNVTESQIKDEKFYDFVMNTLREVGLAPECLELELSENIIILEHDIEMIQTIKKLSQAGILITLDDFGTGYSNPDYLKRIPVDKIKIAKVQMDTIHVENTDLLRSFVMLATEYNLELVAEGVETLKQLEILSSEKCVAIQGNYFSEPLSHEKMKIFLSKNKK